MNGDFYFKFFAREYLTDGDIDRLTSEGRDLLIHMWCLCCLHGSCPSDPEQIRRLTKLSLADFPAALRSCMSFFNIKHGRLYSVRMEREKERREQHRKGAKITNSKGRGFQQHPLFPQGVTDAVQTVESATAHAIAHAPATAEAEIATAHAIACGPACAHKPEARSQSEQCSVMVKAVEGSEVVEPVEAVQKVDLEPLKKKSHNMFHEMTEQERHCRLQDLRQQVTEIQKRRRT